MDDETRAHLEAMEARLMQRITGLQEQMLERFSAVDGRFRTIEGHLVAINTTMSLAVNRCYPGER